MCALTNPGMTIQCCPSSRDASAASILRPTSRIFSPSIRISPRSMSPSFGSIVTTAAFLIRVRVIAISSLRPASRNSRSAGCGCAYPALLPRRLADVFAELRSAFLSKGAAAFLGFLGRVVQGERFKPETADRADVLRIGVERALGDRDRGRALFEYLLAPAVDLGVELIVRNDGIHQSHVVRLLCRVAPAEIPD